MDKQAVFLLMTELRKRLIIIAVSVILIAVACFVYIEQIRYFLVLPGEGLDMRMIYLTPAEALMANLRLSMVSSALITLPLILYQVVAIALSLTGRGRRGAFLLTLCMYILFALGLTFSYFVVLPFALKFFISFSAQDLAAEFSIARYLSFMTSFLFSFGLVFQMPLVFWFLGSIGIVSTAFLRRNRKFALLIIVIFAAVLTPPDVFSQILMAIPLMLLYELGILLVFITQRKRARKGLRQAG